MSARPVANSRTVEGSGVLDSTVIADNARRLMLLPVLDGAANEMLSNVSVE